MPRKPKKGCIYPGCNKLTDGRYCDEHKARVDSSYNRYTRDKNVMKKYNHEWQKIRTRYVEKHPFCERCYNKGVIKFVEEVHHILPVAKGGTHDESNLMSLCRSCHNKVHHEMGER